MVTVISVLHVVVAIALIMIILMQTGRGSDIGAAFGAGASQTVFGSSGSTPFLNRVTVGAAVVFMLTSLLLAYASGHRKATLSTIMKNKSQKTAPVKTGTKPKAAPVKPTPESQPKPESGTKTK
jgi:preprotein translocase subunit SecG